MARRLFDNLLESGFAGRREKKRAISLPVSIGIHVTVLTAVILIPILLSGRDLPEPALGAVSAFFVEPAPPPPPPPPPPPAAAKPKAVTPPKVEQPKPTPVEEPKFTAPVETPKEEPKTQAMDFGVENGVDEGVTGGVQGGTVGGVEGGTVGGVQGGTVGGAGEGGLGIGDAPAPPAPPQLPKGPVRVGGKISEPRKTHNTPPLYPEVAKRARGQGTVILEATISPQGRVAEVKVLRGIPMLDEAAMSAVRQWTYTPTMLNGVPVPVIMTVTVNFRLDGSSAADSKPSKEDSKAAKQEPAPAPASAPAAPAPQAPAPAAQAPAPALAAPAPAPVAPAEPPAEQPAPEATPPPGG